MPTVSIRSGLLPAALAITLAWLNSSAGSDTTTPSVTDDAAVFRQHANLKAELLLELDALHRDTGVTLILKTTAFSTESSPAKEAGTLAKSIAATGEHPVVTILYVRGNRSAGVGTSATFDAIVPAFELASLMSHLDDETGNAAKQLSQATHNLIALARRYSDASPVTGPEASASHTVVAGRWLLASVLTVSAMMVAVCAWCSREKEPTN